MDSVLIFSFESEKAPDSNKKDLLAEYELMKQLQPHPNVIRLMGAVTLSGKIFSFFPHIITDLKVRYFMEGGLRHLD